MAADVTDVLGCASRTVSDSNLIGSNLGNLRFIAHHRLPSPANLGTQISPSERFYVLKLWGGSLVFTLLTTPLRYVGLHKDTVQLILHQYSTYS